jgi:hypothetical protein
MFSCLLGHPPHFRPTSRSRPTPSRAPASTLTRAPRTLCLIVVGAARPMAAMRRRRRAHGTPMAPTPLRIRLHRAHAPASTTLSPIFLPLRQQQSKLTRSPPPLHTNAVVLPPWSAVVDPSAVDSPRPRLHLTLLSPVLALASPFALR